MVDLKEILEHELKHKENVVKAFETGLDKNLQALREVKETGTEYMSETRKQLEGVYGAITELYEKGVETAEGFVEEVVREEGYEEDFSEEQ